MPDLSWRRAAAVTLKDAEHVRADPAPLIVLTLMPLLIMGFLSSAFEADLTERYGPAPGGIAVTGAEQAVPGIAAMFCFFLVSYVGQTIFREHGWRTWNRLRASPLRAAELIGGRVTSTLLLALTQQTVLFAVGGALFGLHVRGSVAALAVVAVALAASMVCFGFALIAFCRSMMQLNALAYLTGLLFAGCGGGIVPYATLPLWAQALGKVTPTYWAMRGFNEAVLGGAGVGGVLLPVAVLLGLAAVFALAAWCVFRPEQVKVPWS
ncbi:ABC transporter permease [Streptomyces sp. MP131-18]|uniref:ABC transporter permease n=1 Tax=Streptomyces sp. MP131-18 TaxID=1857892 RepID=UPI00097BB93D|nr:ABC transporter permease [Streptomyces sp. MP131-18]ONK14642.1 Inner membrane transport permease YbhR [Streptomyces sp. MP131-18]